MDKKTLRILVVEDSPEDQETILRYLKKDTQYEYTLFQAYTGEEGLELCRSQMLDCILLDYRLPDMDGLEILEELSGKSKQTPFPVVFLTGTGDEELAVKAMKSGATDYLLKYKLRTDLLVRTIRHAIESKRVEMALIASEELHRTVMSNISDAVFITDRSGAFTFICPNVHFIFGYSEDEVRVLGNIAKLLGDGIFDPDDLEAFGEIENIEFEITDKTGNRHVLLVNIKQVSIDSGAVLYSCREITQRKQAEDALREREERFRTAFENAAIGMCLTGIDGRLFKVNSSLCRMLGYSERELISLSFVEITHPDDLGTSQECVRCLLEGERDTYRMEKRYRHKEGDAVWSDMSTFLLRNAHGSPLYFITQIQNINARKQAEEELKLYKDHLEKLVEERTAELKKANIQLQQEIEERKRADEQLRDSEEKFRNLIETLPIGVSMSTSEGTVIELNPALLKMFAYDSREDFIKVPASAHYDNPKDRERFIELHEKGLVKDFEVRFKRKDGTVFWGKVTSTTQTTVAGATQFVNAVEDITERKQADKALRESRKQYRQLVESTSDWVWVCDVEGRQTFANKAVKTILGYEIHEIIGTLAASLMHNEDRERDRKWFKGSVEEKKGWISSVARWQHKDGTVRFLESTARPVLDPQGNLVGFTGIDRDVTKRKLAEEEREMLYEEIKSLNLELENKVKDRTRALELAVLDAEEANLAKSNFLAGMSHELRTPLNAVIGFSQVLMEKYFGELNEKQESYIRHILDSGNHLLELINDILDLAKVESGQEELELTRVKIGSLLENSLVIIREKAKKRDISLDLHIVPELADCEITADERKLKQVMYNLLSNAVKFTPDRGEIHLSVDLISDLGIRISESGVEEKQSAIQNPKSKVEISVADSGIGIAPENIEKIFEEFHRVKDDLQYKPGGTGLGLALSKRFVEMHEGRLWVESEGEGRGSRFSFIVPVIPAHLEEVEPEAEATLLSHLSRVISLSEQQNKPATLCRLLADEEHLKRGRKRVKRVLEEEKRNHDILVIDQDYNFYLILQQTDRQQAKVSCDRFSEKLEGVVEDLKASWSMATFPENGEDAATLLGKVSIQQE